MALAGQIGLGVIGVGRHGIRYVRHIVQDLLNARLYAVCRQNPSLTLDVEGAEGVPVYGSYRQLIADPKVDAVVIVTPPVFNREICLAAIESRKPILVEKPLAATLDDARAIVDAATRAGVPLMTAQTLRFDEAIRILRDKRSSAGTLQHLVLTSRIETKGRSLNHAEGYGRRGALLEFGVHLLDLARYVTGEEIRSVRCLMHPQPPTQPEHLALVQLRTAGGIYCCMEVARVTAGRVGRAEWIGSDGQIQADWTNRQVRVVDGKGSDDTRSFPQSLTILSTLQSFLSALTQGQSMPITGEDGCRAVELAEACYRSAADGGQPVELIPTE